MFVMQSLSRNLKSSLFFSELSYSDDSWSFFSLGPFEGLFPENCLKVVPLLQRGLIFIFIFVFMLKHMVRMH